MLDTATQNMHLGGIRGPHIDLCPHFELVCSRRIVGETGTVVFKFAHALPGLPVHLYQDELGLLSFFPMEGLYDLIFFIRPIIIVENFLRQSIPFDTCKGRRLIGWHPLS
jgi:hypothetical protein